MGDRSVSESRINLRRILARKYQTVHRNPGRPEIPYSVALNRVDNNLPPRWSYVPLPVPQAPPTASQGTTMPRSLVAPLVLNREWLREAHLMDWGVGRSLLVSGPVGSGKSTMKTRILQSLFSIHSASQLQVWVVDDIIGPTHPIAAFQQHPIAGNPRVERMFHQENPARLLRTVSATLRAREDFLDSASVGTYTEYLNRLDDPAFQVAGYRPVRMPPLLVVFDHLEDTRTHRVVKYLSERGPRLGVGVILTTHEQPAFLLDDTMTLWSGFPHDVDPRNPVVVC